jgi:hypothetical protein
MMTLWAWMAVLVVGFLVAFVVTATLILWAEDRALQDAWKRLESHRPPERSTADQDSLWTWYDKTTGWHSEWRPSRKIRR